ncbi:MAG: MnmC family methyltransferase [Methanobacteriaceae archaeon]|nr:MnmC family methyltransferase [Methanobacteriaceae archaeon]
MTYIEDSTVIDNTIYDLINEAFEKERAIKDPKYRNSIFKEHIDYFVKTDDGSYSIKSKEINDKVETLHTISGAISESFEKFVKPLELNYDEDIAILDICSGLGYNSSAALDDFIKHTKDKENKTNLRIDLLEISKPTLAAGLLVPSPIEAHNITKKAIEQELIATDYASLELEETEIPENISMKIYIDDARKVIQDLPDNTYDAIFLDPFSQNMSPELFSVDFFNEFRRVIKDNGIVATYTSSAPVRMAFIEANFYVSLGPIFGRFQGGTLASPNPDNLKTSLPKNDEIKMALSDVGITFKDPKLNLSSKEILDNRQEERHTARHNTKISSAVKTPIFLGQKMEDEPLKRRVERNLAKMNIPGVLSDEALYIVEPMNNWTEDYSNDNNSRTRILEMMARLDEVSNKN